MKHLRSITKTPAVASDIPASSLITFLVAILTAIAGLFTEKESIPDA